MRRRARKIAAVVAATVVVVDQISKWIAVHTLAGKGVVTLLGGHFHLELYRNFAGPDNILQGHTVLVSLLSLAAVLVIAGAAWTARTPRYAFAVGLLLGGGVGNLLDRLLRAPGPFRGGVVDWIKPTLSGGSMNLSDLSIDAAIIALLAAVALDWRDQRRSAPREDPAVPPAGPV